MIRELWVSSIFCPRPICAHERRKWNKHAKRFAVSYRKCSDQQERKANFVKYVKEKYKKEAIVSIAKQACKSGLWPFGTPRKHKPGYDPQEACRQAVYREIRKLKNLRHNKFG